MKGSLALRAPTQTGSLNMAVTNVDSTTWQTVIASLTYGVSGFEIFNPSGTTMLIATGSAGHEVAMPYRVLPGGSAFILPLPAKAGDRLSVKAIPTDTTAANGFFTINCFG